jgi:hypothetical protein
VGYINFTRRLSNGGDDLFGAEPRAEALEANVL